MFVSDGAGVATAEVTIMGAMAVVVDTVADGTVVVMVVVVAIASPFARVVALE